MPLIQVKCILKSSPTRKNRYSTEYCCCYFESNTWSNSGFTKKLRTGLRKIYFFFLNGFIKKNKRSIKHFKWFRCQYPTWWWWIRRFPPSIAQQASTYSMRLQCDNITFIWYFVPYSVFFKMRKKSF